MTGDTLVVNGLGIHVLSQNWFSKQSIARDNKNQPVTVEQLELPSPTGAFEIRARPHRASSESLACQKRNLRFFFFH